MKNATELISQFLCKPLLIDQAALQEILAALRASREDGQASSAAYGVPMGLNRNVIKVTGGIASIPVLGLLTYRSLGLFSFLFGATSYEEIRANFQRALADPSVLKIVFDIASPGGTSEAVFDLVDEIYQARGVKPMYAIINETACSAAYLIASAADKIYLPRLGRGGSIGAKMIHVDEIAADAKAGLKYTEIYEGERKNDGTPYAALSQEALASYQKLIGQHMDLLVSTIARNRGLKAADVRAQQSAIYTGKEAVAAGLADAVLSWDGAWKRIAGGKALQEGTMKTKLQALFAESREAVIAALAEMGYVPKMEGAIMLPAGMIPAIAAALGIDAAQLTGDLAKVDFAKLGVATIPAAVTAAETKARKDTLAYAGAIFDICAVAGRLDMVPTLIAKQMKVDDARKAVVSTALAGMALSGLDQEAVNPLLADARKRADGEKSPAAKAGFSIREAIAIAATQNLSGGQHLLPQ